MVLNKVFTILISAIFLSLFLSGVQLTQEPVKLVPFDVVAVVFSAIVIFIFISRSYTYVTIDLLYFSFISLLLLVWHVMHVLGSTYTGRAVTLLAILIRDIVISVLVATIISNDLIRKSSLSRSFFTVSVLVSFATLPLFLIAAADPGRVVAGLYRNLIYRMGEGLVPHLQGFSHNPIYFATLTLLSLIAGLFVSITNKRHWIWTKVGLLGLIVTFFMSFQRGPIIVLMVGMMLMIVVTLPFPTSRRFFEKYIRGFLYIAPLILFLLLTLRLPGYKFSLYQRILYRLQEAEWSARLDRWSQMLSGEGEISWLVGHGLREAERFVGGMFVENAYVEIFYEQGLIGLILWGLLFVYILFLGIKKLQKDSAILPWCWGWLLLLLSMSYISMHYDPLTWVVAGIIVGWRSTPNVQRNLNNSLGMPEQKQFGPF